MTTRFVPTAVHAMSDYPTGAALLALPAVAGLDDGPESTVPKAIGLGVLAQSLFTDYEGGVVRKIPMSAHLTADLGAGLLLAASPWLFGFSRRVWVPHLLMGLMQVGAALTTKKTPGSAARAAADMPALSSDGTAPPVNRLAPHLAGAGAAAG